MMDNHGADNLFEQMLHRWQVKMSIEQADQERREEALYQSVLRRLIRDGYVVKRGDQQ